MNSPGTRRADTGPGVLPRLALGPVLLVAAIKLLLHLLPITRYGWFRDEMYYLACADHAAAGYVDQPPLSIWILAAWRAVFGESLAAIRVLPMLCDTASTLLAAAVARELGGGRTAQWLAALALLAAPVTLGLSQFYSMNAFELVLWPLATLLALRAFASGSPRAWLGLGLVLALALLDKLSALWLGAGLATALVLTPYRAALRTPWPYAAAVLAGALFAPHVIWQAVHGWPTLEFMRNATEQKMVDASPVSFVKNQILSMGPWTLPLWLGGLLWGVSRGGARGRTVAFVYLMAAAILVAERHSRPSYLTPAYPALVAVGAVRFETWSASLAARAALRAAYVTLLVVGAAISAPLAVPLLPVETYVRYSRALRLAPETHERQEMGTLPQQFADMFGWNEIVDAVARAYEGLSPDEGRRCVVYGQNYGEAGAIRVLGRPRGLPPAISGHNSYWLFGPGAWDGSVIIVIGGDDVGGRELFEEYTQVGRVAPQPLAMPYEQGLPIWVGRRLKVSPRDMWPRVKLYI